MMGFLNPRRTPIPPSFFAEFWLWVTSGSWGVSLGRILVGGGGGGGGNNQHILNTPIIGRR